MDERSYPVRSSEKLTGLSLLRSLMRSGLRELVWSLGMIMILLVRIVTTLTTALLIIGWVVVAFRSDLLNNWFWPAAVSGILLAGSTFLYNVIRG